MQRIKKRLEVAAYLSASERDVKMDLADLKTAAMAKLRKKQKIAKEKRKANATEPPEAQIPVSKCNGG